MALIVIYVGLRFDFRFSPGVIIAIVHDAIITLGYFAFTGREFNLTSVAVIPKRPRSSIYPSRWQNATPTFGPGFAIALTEHLHAPA